MRLFVRNEIYDNVVKVMVSGKRKERSGFLVSGRILAEAVQDISLLLIGIRIPDGSAIDLVNMRIVYRGLERKLSDQFLID